MGENDRWLKEVILSLLDEKQGKSTNRVVQEMKVDCPHAWSILEEQAGELHLSGCLQNNWPSTRIARLLFELEEEDFVKKVSEEGYLWLRLT